MNRDCFDWSPFKNEDLAPRGERIYPRRKKRPCPARFEGEAHGRHKLVTWQVLAMRAERMAGCTPAELATKYKVCQSRVSDICNHKSWKHVP